MNKRFLLKAFLLGFCLIFPIFLISCTDKNAYSEPEDMYIISALGFDKSKDNYCVYVQTVEKGGLKLYTGRGDSIFSALYNVGGMDARRKDFSHCAVILLSDSIDKDGAISIIENCLSKTDISFSAKICACHDAMSVLNSESASGYDIMSAMRNRSYSLGIFKGSRLYENSRENFEKEKSMALPYFKSENGTFVLGGLKIFSKSGKTLILDKKESVYYMMIKGEYSKGTFEVSEGKRSFLVKCEGFNTSLTPIIDSDKLKIKVDCTLKAHLSDGEIKIIENQVRTLSKELFDRYGDIFAYEKRLSYMGFTEFDHKYPEISVCFSCK